MANQPKPKHTFSPDKDKEFFKILRKRVNSYFKENNISKYADTNTKIKAAVMLIAYAIPYGLIVSGLFTEAGSIILLYLLMGLGKAGIGLNIMHDSNHGVFFKKKSWNDIMRYSMNIIGGSDIAWRYQHNVMHHTYTNIAGADEDIEATTLMRNSPHQEWKWFHKFQHIYTVLLYGFGTFSRVVFRDFLLVPEAYREGVIRTKSEYRNELIKLYISKAGYFSLMLLIPWLVLPVSFGIIFLSFFLMHFVTGFILSLVFVCAHVMPSSEFPEPDETGKVDENWAVLQMKTTTNFSQDNKVLSLLVGGLNYQVEHHLFPTISHSHYPAISDIVRRTAEEHGVPYHSQATFLGSVAQHWQMLYKLGQKPDEVKDAVPG